MNIYAIRHGQTEMNVKNLLNSQLDDGLTEQGIEQARQVATLVPSSVKRIYASSLRRTRQTAELINESLHLPVAFCDELMEINFGVLSGTEYIEEYKKHHEAMDYDWRPSGECVDDVKDRVLRILRKIKAENGDGEALVIVHGGIIRMLSYLESGGQLAEVENTAFRAFDLDKIMRNNP